MGAFRLPTSIQVNSLIASESTVWLSVFYRHRCGWFWLLSYHCCQVALSQMSAFARFAFSFMKMTFLTFYLKVQWCSHEHKRWKNSCDVCKNLFKKHTHKQKIKLPLIYFHKYYWHVLCVVINIQIIKMYVAVKIN